MIGRLVRRIREQKALDPSYDHEQAHRDALNARRRELHEQRTMAAPADPLDEFFTLQQRRLQNKWTAAVQRVRLMRENNSIDHFEGRK